MLLPLPHFFIVLESHFLQCFLPFYFPEQEVETGESLVSKQPEHSKENNAPNIVEEEVSDIEDDDVLEQPSNRNQKNRQKKKSTTTTTSSGSDFRSRVQPSKAIQVAVRERNKELQAKNKVSAWLTSNKRNKQQINGNGTLGTNSLNGSRLGREPYSDRERRSIIKDIIEQKAYNRLRGVEYWKDCEIKKRACKGERTWQSMKEHFRKKVCINLTKILSCDVFDRL